MSLLMDITMYSTALGAIFMLALVVTYTRIYHDTHAQFSLGLTIFALVLFAQNILAVYSFATMGSFVEDPFLPYLLAISIAQVLGVLVLFKTTIR